MGEQDGLEAGLDLTRGSSAAVDVVLAGNAGQIDGVVANAHDQPVPNAAVAAVPDERRRGQISLLKFTSTDASGRFTLTGVAPGNYKLFALEDASGYDDPDLFQPLENRGESVSIREGSRETRQLKLIPADETAPGAPR